MRKAIRCGNSTNFVNINCVEKVNFTRHENTLSVTVIKNELKHIQGKIFPSVLKFSCNIDSDTKQIERFFLVEDGYNLLEVKSDKSLEFGNI